MNTSATLIPAYTPLEILLLFQSLHQQGISPATFVSVSELLKNNSFVKDSPTYNPGRLSPDALQNLFQQLLRDELRSGGGSGTSISGNGTAAAAATTTTTTQRRDASLSPTSKKRKLPSLSSTPLPTLEEAQQHADKLPPLINRLYIRYRDHAVQEIQREEASYARETREKGEFVRGDWDGRIKWEESRTPSRNGTLALPAGGVNSGQRSSGVSVARVGVSVSPVPLPVYTTPTQHAQTQAPLSASSSPVLNGPQKTSPSPQLPKQTPVPPPRNIIPDRRTSVPPPPVPAPSPMPASTGAPGHPTLPAASSSAISRPIPSPASPAPARPGTPTIQQSPPAPLAPATTAVLHPQRVPSATPKTSGPRPPVTSGQQAHHLPQPQPHPVLPAHQQGPRPPYQPPQQKTPVPYPQHPHLHPIQLASAPGSGPQPPQHHIPKPQGQKHSAPVLQHPQQASSPFAQKSSLTPSAPPPSDFIRRQEGTGKPKQGTLGQQPHAPTQLKWEPVVTPGASQHKQAVHHGHGTQPHPPPPPPPPPPHQPQQYQHPGLRNPQAASQSPPTRGIAPPHLKPPRPPPPPPTAIGTTGHPRPVLVAPSHPHPSSPLQPLHSLTPQAHQQQQQISQQQTSRPVATPPAPQQQQAQPQPPVQQPAKPGQQSQPPYYPQYGRPPLAHTQPPTTSAGPVETASTPVQPLPVTATAPAAHPTPPNHPVQPPQQPAQQPQQQQQQQQQHPSLQQPLQHPRQQVQPLTEAQPPIQPQQVPPAQTGRRVPQADSAIASSAQQPGQPSALDSPFPGPGPPVPEHLRHAPTPASARPRLSQSPLPEAPISQMPIPLTQTGTGTRWAANPTPGTPRPETGALASPSVVPLSPILLPRQAPLTHTEPALAQSLKKPGSTSPEALRDVGKKPPRLSPKEKQLETAKEAEEKEDEEETKETVAHPKKQPTLDKVDTVRSSRRPSRGATRNRPTLQAITRSRRSKSVASTAEAASPAPPDVASAKIKVEVSTPRIPDDTDDVTADESQPQATPSKAPSQRHRLGKRKRQESTDVLTPNTVVPTTPPSHVLWTRGFPKVSASVLDQIASHRYANMFADKIKARDAPRYHDIVAHPQDLRKIRSAIHAGNKVATHALHSLDGGDPGTPSVWLPWDEGLVPPKGIINTEQLECELVHMFSNAIMYNPDPFRGPGPGFRKVWQREEDERTGVLGYLNEPDVVVKDTRNMYVEVEKLLSELRSAEKDQPPLPPGASGIFTDAHLNTVARSLAEANSRAVSASRERTIVAEDDLDELATDPETVNREHRAKRRRT